MIRFGSLSLRATKINSFSSRQVPTSTFVARRHAGGGIPIHGVGVINNVENEESLRVYTREEVAKHNTQLDCWIIVEKKVANVTAWIKEHPGGEMLLTRAGGDATDLFAPLAGHHSYYARETFGKYVIGRVLTEPRYNFYNK